MPVIQRGVKCSQAVKRNSLATKEVTELQQAMLMLTAIFKILIKIGHFLFLQMHQLQRPNFPHPYILVQGQKGG